MAGETMSYQVGTWFGATCSDDGFMLQGQTEEQIDEAVVGHLIVTHNWTKANAQAYVAGKTYVPPTIQDPPAL